MSRIAASLILLLFSAAIPGRSAAQPAATPGQAVWKQDFEGPANSWVDAGGDTPYTIVAHQRVRGGAHSGQGSEWIQIAAGGAPSGSPAGGGSRVFFAHDIGRPSVIDELRPTLWVFSDRGGLQFLGEVTLPRMRDTRSGKPLTAVVAGSTYSTPGRWQQLVVEDFPRALLHQVHILRNQLSPTQQAGCPVDSREAYVSRVLLNVYGGSGATNVWTDDLEVYGHVPSGGATSGERGAGSGEQGAGSPEPPHATGSPLPAPSLPVAGPPEPLRREVKLANSVLTVNGYPIYPRAVEYRGERLDYLKQLGFNTIWLRTVPSREFLWATRQLGLWLVSPPPPASGYPALGEQPDGAVGPEFEPVLAWDLGHGLTGETLDATRRRAEQVRLADARFSRPLICSPSNNLRNYSRHDCSDLLLIDRRPLGTSLEMVNYGNWVCKQPLMALPGTPLWTTIQTQAGEGLRRQLAALAADTQTLGVAGGRAVQPPPTAMGYEQIRLLVYTAISSGSRGLLFLSDSSLEAQDEQTRQRVLALQLLNQELSVVEPVVAGGAKDDIATAEWNQPLVKGGIVRDGRARIVMPMWLASGSQCVAPEAAAGKLLGTLFGVPEPSCIFEINCGRLEPLRHLRQPGGIQVTLEYFGLSSLLFVAEDPLIIGEMSRRAAAAGPNVARAERYLAGQKLDAIVRVYGQIGGRVPPPGPRASTPAADLQQAQQDLKTCDARLASNDYPWASFYVRRAMNPLRKLERATWDAAMKKCESPVMVPGLSSFEALPWYWALSDRIAAMRPGANRLPGGDFENLDFMLKSGWRHFKHPPPGVETAADLMDVARHGGFTGLRLTASFDMPLPAKPPAVIEIPPLWISSPAVPVEAGQIVRVHGWVNIPKAITGSVDGLMVVDSLTGEEMALRLDKTAGWREFTTYRVVPQSGPMALTFVLTGLGEVRLDDVTIEVMEPGFGATAPASGQPPTR